MAPGDGVCFMKSIFIAAAVAAVASPAFADVVFVDNDLRASSYQTTIYAGPGITAKTYETTGMGPLAGAMATEATSSFADARNGQPARFQFLNTSFVYDPSLDGAITSIEASMYQSLTMTVGPTPVNLTSTLRTLRVLAEQDGKLYEAVFAMNLPYTGAFQPVDGLSLAASDFFLFNTATPWAPRTQTGLDFAGAAITFGFEVTHYDLQPNALISDTAQVVSRLAIDNLSITLRTDPPAGPGGGGGAVPEPATWAMLILGFATSGVALRVRRARTVAAG